MSTRLNDQKYSKQARELRQIIITANFNEI